jgi:hypothetical protein
VVARIVILALLAIQPAVACRVASTESEASLVRADKRQQRQIVRDLSARADGVYVALAQTDAQAGSDAAAFKLRLILNGKSTSDDLKVQVPHQITLGCGESADFTNPFVKAGKIYVIYILNGELLRAGEQNRSVRSISWAEELKIVKGTGAPNKSLERTPEG